MTEVTVMKYLLRVHELNVNILCSEVLFMVHRTTNDIINEFLILSLSNAAFMFRCISAVPPTHLSNIGLQIHF